MANTNILIKRSTTVGRPVSLQAGELAYSYASNTIFIGSPTGNGVVNVGGQYYTSQIDNATSQATPSTIVKRDATGNAAFNFITANIIGTIVGNANSATQLQTPRNFSIDGTDITASAVSFNGTGDVVLNASLDAVPGLSAGSYGSTTAIPVVTVGANGRVLAISTSTISTQFDVQGDTGTTTVEGGEILRLLGGDGITSAVTTNTVTFSVDNTNVVRSNTPIAIQTISGDLEISGNLSVLGTEFITNATSLNIADPLIYLASNNFVSDIVDIGFVGSYNDGANTRHTGLVRHAGNKEFYVFDGLLEDPLNSTININDPGFRAANIHLGRTVATELDTSVIKSNGTNSIAFTTNGYTSTLNNDGTATIYGKVTAAGINLNDYIQGAYNRANASVTSTSTLNNGQVIIGAGSNNVTTLANSTYTLTGALSASKTITSLTVDAYGRVTAATGADIAIDTSQITSGTLGYARGGTGSTSYTTGGLLIAGASGFASLANTTFTLTGALTSNNTITSITVDAYGRFTAATAGAISGLTVPQGGTGLSTITQNGITYGNGAGNLGVTAAAGTADQTWSNQILTVTNAGVPVWTTALDGGQF